MKIGIVDADLLGRPRHRFPNLACMKIAGWHKQRGDKVELVPGYEWLNGYDKIYLSKVFTDTKIPGGVLQYSNITYGGTGFFYDRAEPLPYEVEHSMPDYTLYKEWISNKISEYPNKYNFEYYKDCSIGFLTRGCFRKCAFCVNQSYNKAVAHSPLVEFLQEDKKYICLLDDNFFACSSWEQMIHDLIDTGKPFLFRQGLDERLLDRKKCSILFRAKYKGEYIFAFDNIEDRDLIEEKLKLIREYTDEQVRFYVLCGFDRKGSYDNAFWKQDILDLLERIRILQKYEALPYIMRFEKVNESPYKGAYTTIARWCNQPALFKKLSLQEFCEKNDSDGKLSAAHRSIRHVIQEIPETAQYLSLHWPAHPVV